jgi:hypothetical protein
MIFLGLAQRNKPPEKSLFTAGFFVFGWLILLDCSSNRPGWRLSPLRLPRRARRLGHNRPAGFRIDVPLADFPPLAFIRRAGQWRTFRSAEIAAAILALHENLAALAVIINRDRFTMGAFKLHMTLPFSSWLMAGF